MQTSPFMTGLFLGATLIMAIGAQNAFVLRQGLRREHVPHIVVFCIVADVLLLSLGVAGLSGLLGKAPALTALLTFGGAAFLGWYGVQSLRNAIRPRTLQTSASARQLPLRGAMAQAAGFTFLNPHVYLDTVLLLGSVGASQPPALRLWFIGGAALASAGWFSALGFGARLLAPLFARPRAWQVLDVIVGLTMLAMAAMLVAGASK